LVKGAPAFKPATKGWLVSPAVRPEKINFDHPNYEKKLTPALPKAGFECIFGQSGTVILVFIRFGVTHPYMVSMCCGLVWHKLLHILEHPDQLNMASGDE
jgi:hypothetical protein